LEPLRQKGHRDKGTEAQRHIGTKVLRGRGAKKQGAKYTGTMTQSKKPTTNPRGFFSSGEGE